MNYNIQDIVFNISNYCLASCKYCGLHNPKFWNLDDEMNLATIERLFSDPMLKNLRTIHLTGGSPYLSPKFIPTCEIIAKYHPNCPVNSPYEGLYPFLLERIFKRVIKVLPQYRLGLSIDGPDQIVHEKVRGKDTWHPMMLTYKKLKAVGVNMRLETSVYRENYQYIADTYAFAEYLGIPFYLNFGRWCRRFGNEREGIQEYEDVHKVVECIEEQIKDIGWLKERPVNEMKWQIQKALMLGKKVTFDCDYGVKSIDVDPYGEVYPCLQYPLHSSLGSLQFFGGLSEVLYSNSAERVLTRIANKECQPCPFTCALHWRNVVIEE